MYMIHGLTVTIQHVWFFIKRFGFIKSFGKQHIKRKELIHVGGAFANFISCNQVLNALYFLIKKWSVIELHYKS